MNVIESIKDCTNKQKQKQFSRVQHRGSHLWCHHYQLSWYSVHSSSIKSNPGACSGTTVHLGRLVNAMASKLLNSLPQSLYDCPSFSEFKSETFLFYKHFFLCSSAYYYYHSYLFSYCMNRAYERHYINKMYYYCYYYNAHHATQLVTVLSDSKVHYASSG